MPEGQICKAELIIAQLKDKGWKEQMKMPSAMLIMVEPLWFNTPAIS